MAQVVMFIDAERIRQIGMHAPKKNRGLRDWRKDIFKLYERDLAKYNIVLTPDTPRLAEMVDERCIRFSYRIHESVVAFLVDRQANALS